MKVGIQGVKASFHDLAARKYFSKAPDLELIEHLEHQLLDKRNNDEYHNDLVSLISKLKGILKYW